MSECARGGGKRWVADLFPGEQFISRDLSVIAPLRVNTKSIVIIKLYR